MDVGCYMATLCYLESLGFCAGQELEEFFGLLWILCISRDEEVVSR
ncbi:MAG: hypothetical protein GWN86_11390 [Desulfobacterales bacterium]|nr:hypothetical protein [Desulfobacterales bacterium]